MSVVSVVVTLDDGQEISCFPKKPSASKKSKSKQRDGVRRANKRESAATLKEEQKAEQPKNPPDEQNAELQEPVESNAESNEESADEATNEEGKIKNRHDPDFKASEAIRSLRHGEGMNHNPKVRLTWSHGRTLKKKRPTHVAAFGSGFWYIGDVNGEARLYFQHLLDAAEKVHECDPEQTTAKAKSCAAKISQKLVAKAAENNIEKNNAEHLASVFLTQVHMIWVGDVKYRFRPKRTRREVDVAVLTFVGNEGRRLEVRLWNATGTPGSETIQVWITEYIEKTAMIGWFNKTVEYSSLKFLEILDLEAPPFQHLEWKKTGTNVWSSSFRDLEFEVIEGDYTSQLQMRNNGKYEGGAMIPLQCGPAEELRDHALTFLRAFETRRKKKAAEDLKAVTIDPQRALEKAKQTATEKKAAKKTTAKKTTAKKTTAKKTTAKKTTAKKTTAKKTTAKKKTTAAKKKTAAKKTTAAKKATETTSEDEEWAKEDFLVGLVDEEEQELLMQVSEAHPKFSAGELRSILSAWQDVRGDVSSLPPGEQISAFRERFRIVLPTRTNVEAVLHEVDSIVEIMSAFTPEEDEDKQEEHKPDPEPEKPSRKAKAKKTPKKRTRKKKTAKAKPRKQQASGSAEDEDDDDDDVPSVTADQVQALISNATSAASQIQIPLMPA